jgi:excisionase family DNA binding protein
VVKYRRQGNEQQVSFRGGIICISNRELHDDELLSPATVYQMCARGKLAHIRVGVGRGAIRIRQEDLDAFIAEAAAGQPEVTTPQPRSKPIKLKHLSL